MKLVPPIILLLDNIHYFIGLIIFRDLIMLETSYSGIVNCDHCTQIYITNVDSSAKNVHQLPHNPMRELVRIL